MIIDGLQKTTLLDFPGSVACIIFTRGCNFNCPYCQNSELIGCNKDNGIFTEEYILNYLEKRKNVLDGVVISGGEPLLQKDIKEFIIKIRNLGLKIKLDTNGSNPQKLEELIKEGLIDYVAMDVKNVFAKYFNTIGNNTFIKNIERSIDILKKSNIKYEFRTTIVKEFHTVNDMYTICEFLGKDSKYYLQNFQDSDGVMNHGLHGFTHDELTDINSYLKKDFPNMEIRALS